MNRNIFGGGNTLHSEFISVGLIKWTSTPDIMYCKRAYIATPLIHIIILSLLI